MEEVSVSDYPFLSSSEQNFTHCVNINARHHFIQWYRDAFFFILYSFPNNSYHSISFSLASAKQRATHFRQIPARTPRSLSHVVKQIKVQMRESF